MEKHNIKLTSSEVANLWTNYIGDSMSVCIFKHFLSHVDDAEIKLILEHAMDLSKQHVQTIQDIFQEEGIAEPLGFTDADVNEKASRLFEDPFYLYYVKNMTKGGLATYGAILPNVFRNDIREYFMSCLSSTMELYNETTQLLLSKGLEVRSPEIPYPTTVEFVEKQKFLAGWFGEQRPLSGIEITHLYANIQTNNLGEALTLGFAQVAKKKDVKEYLLRGVGMSKKHIEIFSKYLKSESLPVPMSSNQGVTTSTESPFSDKLMMYHIGLLSGTGMGNYGVAMSLSPRRDLTTMYGGLIAEVGLYAEDGANINIKHKWMERPPQTADRDELTKWLGSNTNPQTFKE
ncbi:Protein of unknown function [Mesobacillus persicus]|uniref:DUF3231 family protein n=1 Tax=Mesobacillus persicus TaxID=930146 RepID=A0A1H7WIR0_9BACI|nr:DUF3231 family protein [Mesobacillus persicus]SEM21380.1 Protein of unknown function [Mesobacillus persicus]